MGVRPTGRRLCANLVKEDLVSVSSARRTTAVVATAAALVGAVTLPAAAAGHRPGRPHAMVFISGVRHDRLGGNGRSHRSLNGQWVDLTNGSRRAMNLDDWTLSDRDGHTYTFPHVRLEGRATVRVHTGAGKDTKTDLYQDRRTRVWDVNADTATLRDARGRVVDVVSWGHEGGASGRRAGARWHHIDGHHGLHGDHGLHGRGSRR